MKKPENQLQRENPHVPRRSPRPLTEAEAAKRDEIYARWLAKGKTPSAGLRNLATACAREVISHPKDSKWARRLAGRKGLKRGGFWNQTPAQQAQALANLAKARHVRRENIRLRKLAKEQPDGKLRLRKRIPWPIQ